MTNRQTLPELLGRISADRHAAELESLNRVIAEERARANRCRDEAVSLRDLLDDVIESLELLAPVPDEPQPDAIPVAELAKVLGCDADAASVRMRLEDITSEEEGPQPDADGWYTHDGESWPACLPADVVVIETVDGKPFTAGAGTFTWAHTKDCYDITRWRYADGRDIKPDAPA